VGQFYFERDEHLKDKAEIVKIRRLSGCSLAEAVFYVEELWALANSEGVSLGDETGNGVIKDFVLKDLPIRIGMNVKFWKAVVVAKWLIEGEDCLIIPEFDKRFGKLAQRRLMDRERKREQRSSVKESDETGETAAAVSASPQQSTQRPMPEVSIRGSEQEPAAVKTPADGAKPFSRDRPSIFDGLTPADLGDSKKMVEWAIESAQSERRNRNRIIDDSDGSCILAIAAGRHALGGKIPVALFTAVITSRRKDKYLEPGDIHSASMRFEQLKHIAEQRRRVLFGPKKEELKEQLRVKYPLAFANTG
jgi:hypothetical protein